MLPDKLMSLLGYCNKGWNLFPLLPKSKLPATANGFKDATNNFGQIVEWHSANYAYNWGLATGRIIVVDIDPKNGGDKDAVNFPSTLAVTTGSGGLHLYYRNRGLDVRNSASKLAPGVDIRGYGGYVVLPPSIHPNGNTYEWLNSDDIAEFPVELRDRLIVVKANTQRFIQPEIITNGSRNDTMFKLSCSLRAKGLLDESILAALLVENKRRCNPPLDEEEVNKILLSSLRYEKE